MKHIILIALCCLLVHEATAQRYMSRTGTIRFFSEAPLENIEAINNQVSGVLDASTGKIAFTLLMKAFSFEKALMQEHFNEKYVESDKYPKASFEGEIVDWKALSDGPMKVQVRGNLTIHGVTNPVVAEATLTPKNGKLHGHSVFTVAVDDYDIKIPAAVRDNIAKTIEITVNIDYEKMD